MDSITPEYLSRAETWLFLTTVLYFIMNGAGIYETAVIIPKWSASPPESFQMFKGKYGLNLKTFWIFIHSIHEVTFILAICFCWKIEGIRNWLLILFTIHFMVRVWTIVYFAPHIIDFQKIANTGIEPPQLNERVVRWRNLNYLRTGLFIILSTAVLLLCFKILHLVPAGI